MALTEWESEVLFELTLAQNQLSDAGANLPEILSYYVQRLGLHGIAVFQDNEQVISVPEEKSFVNEHLLAGKEVSRTLEGQYLYSYDLNDNRNLLLVTDKVFSPQFQEKLAKVIRQLGQRSTRLKERRQLRLLHGLIDGSSDAIQISDSTGKLIYINEEASSRLGINPDHCDQFHVSDFEVIFKDEEVWAEHLQELQGGVELTIESENINQSSGKRYPVEVKVRGVDLDGEWFVIAISRDISHRVEMRERLNKEIQLQELLIDIASKYINLDLRYVESTIHESLQQMGEFIDADRAYIFTYDFVNNTTSNTHEWSREGITPEKDNLQDIPLEILPQWVSKHRKNEAFVVRNVSELGGPDEPLKELLMVQQIKSLITVPMFFGSELIGFVGFDSVNEPYAYTEKDKDLLTLFGQMLVSVINRQKWEQALRLQEEKFRNITANMNLGLIEVDLEDKVLFANQSFCEMSGYSLNELIGQKAAEFLNVIHGREQIKEKSKLRKQGISDSYEVQVVDKQGDMRWWLISSAANYDDRGELIGSIGIHLDITNQKRLEKELAQSMKSAEAAAKAKELFLANMSHEIRTPLNVIIGMIRQLSQESLSSQELFYVKQSEASAKHLLTILNNILDLTKIDSGELELVKKETSLSALLQNVHSIMSSQASEKNIEFKLEIADGLMPALLLDEARLRQVLINLIGNAIKFTDKGSVMVLCRPVQTLSDSQKVFVRITDTGIGMSPEFMSRLFDKFTQEQNESNRRYEGTGLGMAISRDLVGLMGGKLQVASQKDQGTSFWFELELQMGDPARLGNRLEDAIPEAYKGKRVLLVEDNDMNRFIARRSLEFLGFEIIEAPNGQIAIDRASKETFDLILMDIQMPVMDGITATRILRGELKLTTPIIALTANAFKQDIDLYLKTGMNEFITKPYDEQDLFLKLGQVLDKNGSSIAKPQQKTESVQNSSEEEGILYNLDFLNQMSKGDKTFINQMIEVFIKLVNEETSIMAAALEQGETEVLHKTAHKLKANIDYMGISSLTDKIRQLEKYEVHPHSREGLEELTREVIETLKLAALQLSNRLEK